jgi:hypothetical protein
MLPDRALRIDAGQVVRTGYVAIFDCVLACRERMAVGDVDRAYQRVLQLGEQSQWPCPNGHWDRASGRFVIEDGRHEYVASLMLGKTHLLVAWIEGTAA